MEARTRTTISLPSYMMGGLRKEAKRRNTTISSIVEQSLDKMMGDDWIKPNKETIKAIEESRSGIFAGTIDTTSKDAFRRSLGL